MQFKMISEPETMVGLPFSPDDFSQPRLKRLRLVSRGGSSAVRTSCVWSQFPVEGLSWSQGHQTTLPRSIQDRSCASNRFSVLAESDAEDGQPQHHDIGTPPPTVDEGDSENNDTASLVGQHPSWEGPRTGVASVVGEDVFQKAKSSHSQQGQ